MRLDVRGFEQKGMKDKKASRKEAASHAYAAQKHAALEMRKETAPVLAGAVGLVGAW